ncbi:hypothetical protein ACP3V3_01860 [Vibrio sp. PNB22_3_1]
MTEPTQYDTLLNQWSEIPAFLINGFVCNDFSLNNEDEDSHIEVSFYIYGKRGLCAEYFISREEIEKGKIIDGGISVNYSGEELNIVALVPQTNNEHTQGSQKREFLTAGRRAFGETEINIVEADNHKQASQMAAQLILSELHESYNDNIYVDCVSDNDFTYERDFEFNADELRAETNIA